MKILIILGVIFAITVTVLPLKCYECGVNQLQGITNAKDMPKCLTSANNYGTLKTCSGVQAACGKGTAQFGKRTIITRMCQERSAALAGECQNTDQLGMEMEICFCKDKDGCNGAPGSTKASFLVMSMMCAFSMMIF